MNAHIEVDLDALQLLTAQEEWGIWCRTTCEFTLCESTRILDGTPQG